MRKLQKIMNGFTLPKVLAVTLVIGGVAAFIAPVAYADYCVKEGNKNICYSTPSYQTAVCKKFENGQCIEYAVQKIDCKFLINGICIANDAFKPAPLTKQQCQAEVNKGYVTALKGHNYPCFANNDYWMGAMKACHDVGLKLATKDEMNELIKYQEPSVNKISASEFARRQKLIGVKAGTKFLNSTNYNEMIRVDNNGTSLEPIVETYNYAGRNRATKVFAPAYAICVAP